MTRAGILTFVVALAVLATTRVHAVERLREAEGLPYSIDLPAGLSVELLPERSDGAMLAAVLMPRELAAIDILSFNWPSKGQRTEVAIGRTAQRQGRPEAGYSTLAARVGEVEPRLVFSGPPRPGFVNQLAAWVTHDGSQMVLLVSLAASGGDSPVCAFSIARDGTVDEINTGGAASTYGGFEVIDLNDDHVFELITTRNLDGMAGGFSYHAVRTLEGNDYGPQPELFKPYFQAELSFLDWVVNTREQIASDPEPFLNKGLYGFFYAAEYQQQLFGFDSIVEGPDSPDARHDRAEYNRLRREAYQRVVAYRDELRGWLAGGARPSIWKLPK